MIFTKETWGGEHMNTDFLLYHDNGIEYEGNFGKVKMGIWTCTGFSKSGRLNSGTILASQSLSSWFSSLLW